MKRCFSAFLLAALFISCENEGMMDVVTEEPQAEVCADAESGLYVPGKAYVYLSEEMAELVEADLAMGAVQTKSAGLNRTWEELEITSMRRLFPHAGEYEERTRREGLHRWYVVTYSDGITRTKAENSFASLDGVDFIEPVRRTKINDIVYNDLDPAKLWGLNNTVTPGYDINVIPVWEQYTTGDPKVIVGVVDSGVDISHEDLSANTQGLPHKNFLGASKIAPGEHGTHVAGTIAAVGNNGKGIAGVAGGTPGKPGVRVLSCQIFNPDGTMPEAYNAEAIKYSADNGAVISQNSWGYIYDNNNDGVIDRNEEPAAKNAVITSADQAAIDYFIKYAGCDNAGNQLPDSPMKGGVVIFAAGNDDFYNGAPANYDEVIAVGAIASDGKRSDFSNYGDWVDIAAPGTAIYSTLPGNAYGNKNGTSMACPHVSGIAALLVSHFGGPGFTNEMLKDKLLNSATVTIADASKPVGKLVDTRAAFEYGEDVTVEPVTEFKAEGRSNKIEMSWKAPKDSKDKPAYGYLIFYGQDKAAVEAATPEKFEGADYVTCTPETPVGETVEYTLSGLVFSSDYHVKVFAYSYGRSYSEASAVVTAATLKNNPPVITVDVKGKIELKASETVTVPVSFSDPDGHSFSHTYTPGSEADTFVQAHDKGYSIVIVGNKAEPGTYTATITLTDDPGDVNNSSETVSADVEYTILPNRAPVKDKEIDNILLTAKGQEFTIDMAEYVSDPDGDALKYEFAISDPKVLHMVLKNGKFVGVSLGYGTTDVEVTAKDAKGETAVFSFKVQVKDPANPLSVYPNPVTDFVNIATLDEAETHIEIVSQTGHTVYDDTLLVSGYNPAKIDMTLCAPGTYAVTVVFGGKEYKQNIVKL